MYCGRFGVHDALGRRARHEVLALLDHLLEALFAHGLAQNVRLAEREAGDGLDDAQHLVLVDDDAVGLFQDGLQRRVRVLDLLHAQLALDVLGDLRHRAGAVQGDHGRDLADVVGAQLGDVAAHLAAFQLEHAGALAAPQQVIGLAVVQGQFQDVDVDAVVALDVADGAGQDGQVRQAQEVHLEQADLFQDACRVAA